MGLERNHHLSTQFVNLAILLISLSSTSHCIVHPDGQSQVTRYQDALGNYQFGYTVASSDGEHFHKSGTDPLGRVVGSYGMTLADGRRRMVDYVADKNGFRAHIRSNEPGIISAQSADAPIEKTDAPLVFLPEPQRLQLAASDDAGTADAFNEHPKYTSSRVTYMRPDEDEEHKKEHAEELGIIDEPAENVTRNARRVPIRTDDELVIEGSKTFESDSRGHLSDFDTDSDDESSHQLPGFDLDRIPERNSRISLSNGYNPPLDPKATLRPPDFSHEFHRPPSSNNFYTTHQTSVPSTPPYGGFDFRPPLFTNNYDFGKYPSTTHQHSPIPSHSLSHDNEQDRRYPFTMPPSFSYERGGTFPPVTMSSIHGGYAGRYPYNMSPQPQNQYGIRINQYPRKRPYLSLEDVYQPNPGRPFLPLDISQHDRRRPAVSVNSEENFPSALKPSQRPDLVLRAIAIPNGIQAVHVNPATGQVHDDRESRSFGSGINAHNNDGQRYRPNNKPHPTTFTEFPIYRNPLSLTPLSENSPSHARGSLDNTNRGHNHRHYNHDVSKPQEASLSKPSAKDLALISRVFEHVNSQQRKPGAPPDPYHYDSHPFQPDTPPDYPRHGLSRSNPRAESGVIHENSFTNGPRHHYRPEPKDFSDEPHPVRRPSVAVRLPGFDNTPRRYANNRDYRSAPENQENNHQEDEIVSGDNDQPERPAP